MAMSAEQNLQPLTGNSDVPILVKMFRMERKPPNKQKQTHTQTQTKETINTCSEV